MTRISILAVACALVCSLPHRASAQHTRAAAGQTNIDPALAAETKISLDSARAIALGKLPNGSVASEELERENGHLIYSFDVKLAGKSGIEEVNVNALTGKVLGIHHEGPAAEAKEARADSVAAHKAGSARAAP